MVQRNSANAKDAALRPSSPAPRAEAGPGVERRRAAAYLDLWERQLRHAASLGPLGPAARRIGHAGGS